MKTNTKTFFISAFKNNATPSENISKHTELRMLLSKYGYKKEECIGTYNGVPELTFIVPETGNNTERNLLDIANEYKQECIMVVYGIDQTVELVYMNEDRKVIGKMKCLGNLEDKGGKDYLRGKDYTFFNDKFYIVE